jgi:hypothetical protein
MFGPPPDDYEPTEAELDMRARMTPDPDAVARAVTVLSSYPDRERRICVIPMALPNKTRGIWTTGQEVVTVPEPYRLPRVCMEHSLHPQTDAADRAARDWMNENGLTGTTAYALVMHDGTAAMFEGWR